MDFEREIQTIKQRNERVERDKAWEQSWTRRLSVAGLTYVVAVAWLYSIGNTSPFLNGAVPVAGFVLSTLTLTFIKERWQR